MRHILPHETRVRKSGHHRTLTVFYGFYSVWSGGWCFGPRYLADVLPLLMLGFVPWIREARPSLRTWSVVRLLIGASIMTHALGACFTWWWEEVPGQLRGFSNHPVTYLLARLSPACGTEQCLVGWVVVVALAALLAGFARDWANARQTT